MRVLVQAWTAQGYVRTILDADERQVWMTDAIIKQTTDGWVIDPAQFPEAIRFTVKIEHGK